MVILLSTGSHVPDSTFSFAGGGAQTKTKAMKEECFLTLLQLQGKLFLLVAEGGGSFLLCHFHCPSRRMDNKEDDEEEAIDDRKKSIPSCTCYK